eukprot:7750540-Ditylum_brightwellii.AAC.1
MADSGKEKVATFHDKKYQGGKALPFLDHDFTGYHTTQWYQWEVIVQLLAKENKKQLEVENFPKAAKEVKDLHDHSIIDGTNKNVTMFIHVTELIPFGQFKSCMFNWLEQNSIFLKMTIFWNTKETMMKIGHLTKINPVRTYQ